MKSIKTKAIITGIRSKTDRSLGLSVNTPELNPQEKALFFELQGLNVELTIFPSEEQNVEDYEIDTDLNQKPQSVRIRNVLFLLWQQNPEGMEFNEYYKNKTDKYIESLKARLD